MVFRFGVSTASRNQNLYKYIKKSEINKLFNSKKTADLDFLMTGIWVMELTSEEFINRSNGIYYTTRPDIHGQFVRVNCKK